MKLSIITPTLNEEAIIEQTLNSFLKFTHSFFDLEILVVDGMSTDKTREIVQRFSQRNPIIRLIDNPNRKTPFAFNIGIQQAQGEYVAILGAHTIYQPDYVEVCLQELQRTGAKGVAGRIFVKRMYDTVGALLSEAVSTSAFGVSGNSFRKLEEGFVNSIGYPIFEKSTLINIGLYNTNLHRNQDNDMNQRIIDSGGKLYHTWKTSCDYSPPKSVGNLFKYGFKNGMWNIITLRFNRKSMKIHHLIPLIFVVGILGGLLLGGLETLLFNTCYLLCTLGFFLGIYSLGAIIFTLKSMKEQFHWSKIMLPFVFFGFHFSYGWGSINGFTNGPKNK